MTKNKRFHVRSLKLYIVQDCSIRELNERYVEGINVMDPNVIKDPNVITGPKCNNSPKCNKLWTQM